MDQETAHDGENGNSCCIGACTKNVDSLDHNFAGLHDRVAVRRLAIDDVLQQTWPAVAQPFMHPLINALLKPAQEVLKSIHALPSGLAYEIAYDEVVEPEHLPRNMPHVCHEINAVVYRFDVACNVRLFLQEANWAPHRQLTDCVKREIVDVLVETHWLATCSNLGQDIQIEIHHLGNQLFHTQDSGH